MKPIGVFDSGVGGLTVLKHLQEALPKETFHYFGDTARVPWGNKSPETIRRYSLEIARFLLQFDIQALVVACNTASSYALDELKKALPIPVFGVILPAAAQAAVATKGHVAVLGTRATVHSGTYEKALSTLSSQTKITSIACPLLVPFIEEGLFDHGALHAILRDYLAPLLGDKPDTLILGCTHYPLLRNAVAAILGPEVHIIDGGQACSMEVKKSIETSNGSGQCHFYVSDDPARFRLFGELFLGKEIGSVTHISL